MQIGIQGLAPGGRRDSLRVRQVGVPLESTHTDAGEVTA